MATVVSITILYKRINTSFALISLLEDKRLGTKFNEMPLIRSVHLRYMTGAFEHEGRGVMKKLSSRLGTKRRLLQFITERWKDIVQKRKPERERN